MKEGEKYGAWTILKIGILYRKPSGSTLNKALCVCTCGRKSYIEPCKLVLGTSSSCTVCSKLGRKAWNKGTIGLTKSWNKGTKGVCKPNSGSFKKGRITWNRGMRMSDEFRKVVSEGHKGINTGEKAWQWIKDRTQLKRHNRRNDVTYKEWRRLVWLRDNWKCKIDNSDCKGRIEAHHILSWKDYIKLRYEVNNGITLCHAHHPRKRSEEAKLSPYFQQLVAEMN